MRSSKVLLLVSTLVSAALFVGCGAPDMTDAEPTADSAQTDGPATDSLGESEQALIVCQGTWYYGLLDQGHSAYARCTYSTSGQQMRLRATCQSGTQYWQSYGAWVALNNGGSTVAGCGSGYVYGRSIETRY